MPVPDITWRKIEQPKTWRPDDDDDDVLVGYYIGKTQRDGRWGPYEVVVIGVPVGDGFNSPYLISGTRIVQAIDTGNIQPGALVRVTFHGKKEIGEDEDGRKKTLKLFTVETAEGELSIEDVRRYVAHLNGDEIPVEEEPPTSRWYSDDEFYDRVRNWCADTLADAARVNSHLRTDDREQVINSLLLHARGCLERQVEEGSVTVTPAQWEKVPIIVRRSVISFQGSRSFNFNSGDPL